MGTMLQSYDLTLHDFEQLEGCNEILNVTRPDIVRAIHDAYFDAGVDAVETNSFGTNLSALGEYGIAHRIHELAEASARIAREAADAYSTPDRQRWVLGSVGPGTKLPTLGHISYAQLRDAYQQEVEGLLAGGIDAVLIETSQDLLQTKAATLGAKRALAYAGRDLPVIVHVTVETTGTMLLGSEIGAALTSLEPLGIDMIGLNCATGPAEMSEHLRHLSRYATIGVSCMPNAGLPQLTAKGAVYPLQPIELADALEQFVGEFGLGLVGGCCGTGPEHLRHVVKRLEGRRAADRSPRHIAAAASLYADVPFRQDISYLSIGERTNANGSKAFRDALLAERWDDCVDIARSQIRDGAHMLDLNVDYVGRDGAADMRELAFRLATASTLPIVLDSTEPAVLQAGLERLGGRAVINSANYEDGDGPDSRFTRVMNLVAEHGAAVIVLTIDEEGQARTADWKVRVAKRAIADITQNFGLRQSDIILDCLTFPIATGQEETRRDGIETIEAIREVKRLFPDVQTTLGLSNVSFGLNPAARVVLNSVFLNECIEAVWILPSCTPPRSFRWPGSLMSNGKWHSTWSMTGVDRPLIPSPRTTHCNASSSSSKVSRRPTPKPSVPQRCSSCPSANDCSAASSTAKARDSPMILISLWRRESRRWRSSTLTCWPACGWSASSSGRARCSCPLCCSPLR
jgi:5-methyltetrahydrofolate--homocysteine methyltransferase